MSGKALVGAQVFDGATLYPDHAVALKGKAVRLCHRSALPEAAALSRLEGGTILPGFVDLQVNGGGGLMLGDDPSVETVRIMAAAHAGLGTHALLPTLITDTPQNTTRAIAAVEAAIALGVPGIVGLHLEGPHLDPARKGAHDADLIRPMTSHDLDVLLDATGRLPNLMVTLAPENVTLDQISALAENGVIVSLGHSNTDYDTAMRTFDAGARCTTHLFNAMSQLGSRAPGLVGATLHAPEVSAGLIADGVHVHPSSIRAALDAKTRPGEVFLVTDAMACAGSSLDRFTLNGREILRADGRLTLADGTLAGADLSMAQALRVMIEDVGDPPEKAFARATSIPAGLLNVPSQVGRWPDTIDGLIYLSDDYTVQPLADLI